MFRFLAILSLFAFTLPCHAQGDKAKPNTLTPKEIADGWILLFDGETTFGWTVMLPSSNTAKVANGELDLSPLGDNAVSSTAAFASFELQFDYMASQAISLAFKAHDQKTTKGAALYTGMGLKPQERWTTVNAHVSDQRLTLNGQFEKEVTLASPCFLVFDQGRGKLKLRNIKLRPLNTKSIFNGKDLTGWNVFAGKKSKFAVLDNAINVKDGPGDLQTAGKYKDFILQLECISNGEHLNSGIFFRCRDGEYQNGYEAQIRNQFTEEPTQKYLIEEYDPKTNKLVGKKEITSTAFDFGTGAIYRRIPARKQMSKDGEWFGMTIVAHGNHLATWVNGVQVTDWTDNRPKSDNARTGCKLEAGHISIQGHDPTTDLSFRNFRIAEFK